MNEITVNLIKKMERRHAAQGQDIARLRALVGASQPEPIRSIMNLPENLIEVEAAAEIAKVRCDTVRSWCRVNRFNEHHGGFAVKIAGRWWVSPEPFRAFIREKK